MKDYDFQAHLCSVMDQILDQMIEQNRAIRKLQRKVMKVKNKPINCAVLRPFPNYYYPVNERVKDES